MRKFCTPGYVDTIVGGQFGSEAKGAAAAWLADELTSNGGYKYEITTTNAGAQAGHTSIHRGIKRVVFHLPTAPLIARANDGRDHPIYLNAGTVIDVDVLEQEIKDNNIKNLLIHPMASIITDECRKAENRLDSAQTKIASTRKGVGEAISRKVLRSGMVARDHSFTKPYVQYMNLNRMLSGGMAMLMEIPQGISLSLNQSGFYPYTTSRDCTPSSGMSDAGIHPSFLGRSMMVIRTFPIRVGNITAGDKTLGTSGDFYHDQHETSWEELGVQAEITTVTKRVRRVFTFSRKQLEDSYWIARPDVVFLAFCNYIKDRKGVAKLTAIINDVAIQCGCDIPEIVHQWGPTTDDITPF